MANRERTSHMHRMAQLEAERDEAIREAATISGRASADREMAAAKLRELDEMRTERDMLRKELNEVKQVMAGSTAENSAERRQLQARLREIETHNEARINDLKLEIERMRGEIDNLQVELQTVQTAEMELRSTNQHQKWKLHEFEDQISHYTRRITGLERRGTDLDAELVRAKADLSATRETVLMRRSNKTRMADDWLNPLPMSSPNENSEDETRNIFSSDKTNRYSDDGNDLLSDDSLRQNKKTSRSLLRVFESKVNKHQSIPNLSSCFNQSENQDNQPRADKNVTSQTTLDAKNTLNKRVLDKSSPNLNFN